LGKNGLRCRWQMQQGVFGAAVDKIEDKREPEGFIGIPQTGRPKHHFLQVSTIELLFIRV